MQHFFSPEFYISREKELEAISRALKDSNVVAICGHAGIGKTVLVKTFAKRNPLNFNRIYFYQARMFKHRAPDFDGAYLPFKTSDPVLAIVDGIDEVEPENYGYRIVEHFLEAVKYGHKVIFTHRPYFWYTAESFQPHTINLGGLTDAEAVGLLTGSIGDAHKRYTGNDIGKLLRFVRNNPFGIVLAALALKSGSLGLEDVFDKLYGPLEYWNQLFSDLPGSKLILPEVPRIIGKIELINASLIERVKFDSTFLHKMTSRQFEEFVAELFEKDGYRVSLTKSTHDGGKDLFIVENRRFGNFIYYLECKHYSPETPVGVRLVRELYGTVMADRVTAGVLITSSYFSKEAVRFREQVKAQLSLMELIDIKKWVAEISI